jgi:hypothetical protein
MKCFCVWRGNLKWEGKFEGGLDLAWLGFAGLIIDDGMHCVHEVCLTRACM